MSKGDQNVPVSKEASESARFKVIVRRLPPSLSSELFQKAIEGFADGLSWLNYEKGRSRKEGVIYSIAYLAFTSEEKLYSFYDKFQGHSFIDQKGVEYLAQVEYAPHQKIPKPCGQDRHQNTIEDDPSYQSFLEQLKKPVELLPSAEIQIDRQDTSGTETNKGPILSPLILDLRRKREQRSSAKNSPGEFVKIFTRERGKDSEDGSGELAKKFSFKKGSESGKKSEEARRKKEKEKAERAEQAKSANPTIDDDTGSKKAKPRKPDSKAQTDMTVVFKVKESSPEANTPAPVEDPAESPKQSQDTSQSSEREKRRDARPDQQLWTRKSLQKALEPGIVKIQKKDVTAASSSKPESSPSAASAELAKPAAAKPMPEVSIKLNPSSPNSDKQTIESSDPQSRAYEKPYPGSSSGRKGNAAIKYVVKTKPPLS